MFMKCFGRRGPENPHEEQVQDLAASGYQDRVDHLRQLLKRFDPGEKITTADLVEALRIIQLESTLRSTNLRRNADGFMCLDLLTRCVLEIIEKGNVKLSAGSLSYIRQKLPIEPFVKAEIQRHTESTKAAQDENRG